VDAFGWEVVGSLAGVVAAVAAIVAVLPRRQRREVASADPQPTVLPPTARKSYLSRGESLLAGQSLYSPNGRTRFTLQDNANMVVSFDGVGDICDTGTTNIGQPKCLSLQEDGWLILYDVDDKPLWKQGPGGDHLNMQDNSHVVLYPAVGAEPVWATRSFFKAGQLVDWIPLRSRVRFFDV
jgi:hypothetical protein